jgi:hypothetical protein
VRRRVGHVDEVGEHVLGQCEHDGPRPAGRRDGEGARDELRDAGRVVDLRDPLRHRPEHGRVVELLEALPPDGVAGDLAHEQDHRRRVLRRGVQAVGRVRRPRPPRDEADARAAGELPVGVGHVRRAALVARHDEPQRRVAQRVEHR